MGLVSKKYFLSLFVILLLNFILVDINLALGNLTFFLFLLVIFLEYILPRIKKVNLNNFGEQVFIYKDKFKLKQAIITVVFILLYYGIIIGDMKKNSNLSVSDIQHILSNITFSDFAITILVFISILTIIIDLISENKVGNVFYKNGVKLSNGRFVDYSKIQRYSKSNYKSAKSYKKGLVKFEIKVDGYFGYISIIQETSEADRVESILKRNIPGLGYK